MNIKICMMFICVCALSSCGMRTSWDVPDRGGHAHNSQLAGASTHEGARDNAADSSLTKKKIIPEDVPQGEIMIGERVHAVMDGERLYQIAERNGVTMHWIIKRNDLGKLPVAGSQLIVPSAGAH
ncbi:MAG: LysM peptidoglycan-binding domain-containing protein [Planctomycetes bacterium]|nr:LysM peptidoglycan-binding domain-containing protein [Planctomycetota bacterium]